MAVLLECHSCYQHYVVPAHAARRPPRCPWCGALPASEEPPGTSFRRSDSASAFPPLSPARFPLRRRGVPAWLWVVIGVGFGACIVLGVLMYEGPDAFRRSGAAERERSLVKDSSPPSDSAAARPSTNRTASVGEHRPIESLRADARQSDERQRELVRQLLREEMRRALARHPADEAVTTTPRWLSDRPPPIGDPEDDSPDLGLMLRDRVASKRFRDPAEIDGLAAGMPDSNSPARPLDDPSAVEAITKANIRLERDAHSGRITRLDASFSTTMNDALMAHVAKLQSLVHLKLSFTDVTDAGLAHVRDLTSLQELLLNETKITDAGLAHLEKLTQLEKLDLERTSVSDAGLAHLKPLRTLKHIDIRGSKTTPSGVDDLQKALPSIKIRH